jgi:hypothetical protein
MIAINMPGGGVEYVDGKDLFWMRQAFDHEFKGAVMLMLTSDRVYSIESLSDLSAKFIQAGVAIARFTPPEGTIDMLVSAKQVQKVEPPNPTIYHEHAKSILKFNKKLMLSVRENEGEAKAILAEARNAVSKPDA